jgi:hypothetical protein
MMTKAAVLAALIAAAASQPLLADPAYDPVANYSVAAPSDSPTAPVPETTLVMRPGRDVPGDIVGGRGPNPHARELNSIAVYDAIGNRDGAEMLAAELAGFGIKRRDVQGSVQWKDLHGHSGGVAPTAAAGRDHHAEMGWEASQ